MLNSIIKEKDDIFQQVKAIPFPEVQRAFHGAAVKHNKTFCPFHQDKNPSLHIYHNGFKCFSCEEAAFQELIKQAQNKLRGLAESIRRELDLKGVDIEDGLVPLVHELPRLEWWADTLETGTDEEKRELHKDKELRRWRE